MNYESKSTITGYALYDTYGHQVKQGQIANLPQLDIPMHTLPPSIYIVEIYLNNGSRQIHKVVKQ